jgi:hypothetical protein
MAEAQHQGAAVIERPKRKILIYECKKCHGVLGNSDFLMPNHEDQKFIYLSGMYAC